MRLVFFNQIKISKIHEVQQKQPYALFMDNWGFDLGSLQGPMAPEISERSLGTY